MNKFKAEFREIPQPDGTTHDESYLGDGLYATFDGWQIVLRAPRPDGDHWVALEPELYTNLVRFAERINGKYAVEHFKALRGDTALADMQRYIMRLERENWQLKQACGYPIPADKESIHNPFKCGLCDANKDELIRLREIRDAATTLIRESLSGKPPSLENLATLAEKIHLNWKAHVFEP